MQTTTTTTPTAIVAHTLAIPAGFAAGPRPLPPAGRYLAIVADAGIRRPWRKLSAEAYAALPVESKAIAQQDKKSGAWKVPSSVEKLVVVCDLLDDNGNVVHENVWDWLPLSGFSRTYQLVLLFCGATPGGPAVSIDASKIAGNRVRVNITHKPRYDDASKMGIEIARYLAA